MDQSKDANDSNPQASSSSESQRREREGNLEPNGQQLPPHFQNRHQFQPLLHEFCPRPQHPRHCNSNTPSPRPPSIQWQYFMRHQPFGESARPYQFPPPPHFPQQFHFGTFPGRNNSRSRQWRDNLPQRSNINGVNDHHHCQQASKDVRPKTGPFANGKKKIHRKRGTQAGCKSNRNKKCHPLDTNNDFLSNSDVGFSASVNPGKGKAKPRVKTSLSCDERLLNELASDNSSATPNDSDFPLAEEGAVGGVPVMVGKNHGSDRGSPVDKELIDEGAVFDLDNVFKNHENSRLGDPCQTDSEFEDNPDYVFDFKSGKPGETVLSSDNSESENGAYGGSVSSSKVYKSHRQWNGLSNKSRCEDRVGRIRNSIGACGVLRNNVHERNIPNNPVDSDNGEDTGDFIDTDLPSHTKHILSSSDEMDNLSSARESEEEDSMDRFQSLSKKKCQSDVNCNDLSTLEPNILNGINSLDVRDVESKNMFCPVFSNLPDRDSRPPISNCDMYTKSEGATGNSRNCNASSHVNNGSVVASSQYCSRLCNSHNSNHGAAADLSASVEFPSRAEYHPGADSELSPTLLECFHHPSCNFTTITSAKQDSRLRPSCSNHPALTASSEHCSPHPSSPNQSSASGTSTAEESGGCCSNELLYSEVNDLDSVCYHRNHGLVANGFNEDEISPDLTDDENNSQLKPSAVRSCEDEARASASALQSNVGLDMTAAESSEKSPPPADSLREEGEDAGLLFENNLDLDTVDMVLLPMEEEIEPVHSMEAPRGLEAAILNFEDKDFCSDSSLPPPFNAANETGGNSSLSEENHHFHVREWPVSSRNRLPSKEFYELIKRVSATESFMRFFDKDGQDVQRSTQRHCNEDDTNSVKIKYGGKSSGSKGDCLKVDRVMIWNEYEAYVVQYKQIAVSACGQTAVLNVLKALKFQCEKSVVCKVIKTNLRREDQDIPQYLFSRACAGTTAAELMQGMDKLTGGVIGGRFFHFWPPRKVKLLQWLAYWMKRGAIPLATLNLQQGPHSMWEVPDSWHHQMVYGVSHQGLYLTNPLEIVSERSAVKQLHSDSVLLVRRQDIVSRFRESTDLGQLVDHPDSRWMSMNVLGQVVNVLRECNMPSVPGYRLQVTSHVRIPASYQAGITLFMRKDKPAWRSLLSAPELPLEEPV